MTKRRPPPPKAKPKPRPKARPVHLRFDARSRQLPAGEREEEDEPPRPRRAEAEAPAPDDDLGPIVLPAADEARRVLGELAALYDERHGALRRYKGLKDATKAAAEAVSDLDTRIAERLRVTTHRSGLPLLHGMDDDREPGSEG